MLHPSDSSAVPISSSGISPLSGYDTAQSSSTLLIQMNEHLQERFSRPSSDRRDYTNEEKPDRAGCLLPGIREAVQKYYRDSAKLPEVGGWVSLPEIPTSSELGRRVDALGDQDDSDDTIVKPNNITNAWQSKDEYLKAQYNFCREESTFALRNAIDHLQRFPDDTEVEARSVCSGIGIYEKAHVKGLTVARNGLAVRMSFSTDRSRVHINWKTSKRLVTGSLIALTPVKDMFKTRIIPAVVAARSLLLVDTKTPEIDIFFHYDAIFDPMLEYVIVEETSVFFEAQRHNLLALQKMTQEGFPLHKYLIDPKSNAIVGVASNLRPRDITTDRAVFLGADRSHSHMNIVPALKVDINPINGTQYTDVDVLSDWPEHKFPTGPVPSLDESQLQALKQMLVSEVALIQGPPGTGKTHVSLAALGVLVEQWRSGDPPILVSCQTNHALDQLLLHISRFCPDFVRLGGRTADTGIIKARTLHEIRNASRSRHYSKTSSTALRERKKIQEEINYLLAPLDPETGIFDHEIFYEYDLITKDQRDSIEYYSQGWDIGHADLDSENTTARGSLSDWLGGLRLTSQSEQTPESMDFDRLEEEELEDEQIDEAAAELAIEKDGIELLRGDFLPLSQKWSSISGSPPDNMSDFLRNLKKPKYSDLTKPPPAYRRYIYEYLVEQCKTKISDKLLSLMKKYNELCKDHQMGIFESDLSIIKKNKLVGLTTTGFSKYRPLIAASGAKIVLLEEAGESLECTVVPLFIPSIEQIIQVGDHKQLQPRPQKRIHERMLWGISLFERLVGNGVDMRILSKQRRMRSEISRLLRPIYGPELLDYETEDNRAVVPGMGGFNTWFMHHESVEGKDAMMSTTNEQEAALVAEFAGYLILNGVAADKISILTLYSGQRKRLNAELRKHRFLQGRPRIRVSTVDSYQGEENDVILLSLVRSNDYGDVGFAGAPNRVNVALSRARLGLYMFGNRQLLENHGGELWKNVFEILDDQGDWDTRLSDPTSPHDAPDVRVGNQLFLVCDCGVPTHEADREACRSHCARSHEPNTIAVRNAHDFTGIHGGCTRKCLDTLDCGHQCPLPCHPTPHSEVVCNARCSKILSCGHKCVQSCRSQCRCEECQQPLCRDPPTRIVPVWASAQLNSNEDITTDMSFPPISAILPVLHGNGPVLAPPARIAWPSTDPGDTKSTKDIVNGIAYDRISTENTSLVPPGNSGESSVGTNEDFIPPTAYRDSMPQALCSAKKKGK